jgi:tetratricopeptide (TPR) repeat protein/DNA-binding winged helix-turn-helix (wHTH) protein
MRVRLEGQPAKVLELIIEANGALVSRKELIAVLWPGEVEGNFDRRLDKAVAKLRASLNDDPAEPLFIETLKGRGYRLLNDVKIEWYGSTQTSLNPSSDGELPAFNPVPDSEIRPTQKVSPLSGFSMPGFFKNIFTIRGGFVVGAALVLTASIFAWWQHRNSSPPHPGRPVLLVLGFRDSSAGTEDTWVSHSVSEWLSTDLATGGELQIIQGEENPALRPREQQNGCGELPPSVLEIARRAFAADMVVYGDYIATDDGASGELWRMDVCLKGTQDHKSPDSMTVIGAKGNISQLVFNAGELLRSKLGLKHLSNQSLGYLQATLPSNLAAARLYAEGTSALEHFEPEEASALLTQAAQIEPQHAPTHAALSTAWAALGYQQRSQQEALIARDLAKGLSPTQELEYAGLAAETNNDWTTAIDVYTKLLALYSDSIGYGLKLAYAQISAAKAQLALQTVGSLRVRNSAALADPRVDLAEAVADSALSDFRGELAASIQAQVHAEAQSAGLLIADARMQQGDADDMLGNSIEALRIWRQAGQSYESIGDRGGMARALNHQALLAWHKSDVANATKLFEESIKLSSAIGDNAGIADSLSRLGAVRMATDMRPGGEMPAAVEMFRQAAAIYHTVGNMAGEAYALSLIGDEAMQRSRFEEAHSLYLKSIALSQAANDKSGVAGRLLDLGIVAQSEGHNPEALKYDEQSSQLFEEIGQKDRAAIARDRLGVVLFRAGKIENAESVLQDSLSTIRSSGRRNQLRQVMSNLATVELIRDPAKAEALMRDALSIDIELSKQESVPPQTGQLAEAELAQGRLREAKETIRQAFLPGEKSLSTEFLPNMLLERGDVKMSDRDYSGASSDFNRAMVMARVRGARYMELESRLGLAEVNFRQKGPTAMPELERLKHDADQMGYGIFAIKIETFLHSPASAR